MIPTKESKDPEKGKGKKNEDREEPVDRAELSGKEIWTILFIKPKKYQQE